MSDASRRWLELSVRCPSAEDSIPLLAEGLVGVGARATVEQDGWCVTHFSEPDDPEAFVVHVRNALVANLEAGLLRPLIVGFRAAV